MQKKRDEEKKSAVPFTGERLQLHQHWMSVMSEGQATPLSDVETKSVNALKKMKKI